MWPLSDEALLAGFAAGESEAAAEFVRRFQGRVYGLAFTIVGDSGVAEDVAQEAFVRAWRHAATFDPRRGRVSTWLLTIARNLALDRARLNGSQPVDPDFLAAMLQRQTDGRDSGHAGQVEERDEVRALLGELPVEQRRVLVLATYFGRTAQEISDLDGVPLGTVKTRLRTAMLRLRRRMEVGDESA